MRRFLALAFVCCSCVGAKAESLDSDVLKKVKAATVFLRVNTPRGEMEGSGFFCEGNLIVTNAHVVGMKRSQHPPSHITVVINSGLPGKEVITAGGVIAFDPEADLAFIKPVLDDKKVPVPLALSVGKDVAETTPVFIFGYPFGDALAGMQGNPAVTVGSASVSSLRLDQYGLLDTIQINGDLNPGNSGGPIVNKNGEVVAISVATVLGTQIGFAIPCDKVRRNLAGRVSALTVSNQRHDGDLYECDIQVAMIDPLSRIKSVNLYGWTAKPGSKRPVDPATKTALHGADGDGERQKWPLTHKDHDWVGHIAHLRIPGNAEFWFQIGATQGAEEKLAEATRSDLKQRAVDARAFANGSMSGNGAAATPVNPGKDVVLRGTTERTADGKQYILVSSAVQKLKLPANPLQLVAAPSGKFVYGIFEGNAGVKIFQPPDFTEVDEIPVPRNPVGIWCDEKRIVVACDDSRVVTILDAEKRKPIKSVMLKDEPALKPIRIVGRAPGNNGYMTLWQSKDAAWWDIFLYNATESGEMKMVAKAAIDWCVPVRNNTELFAQHNFRGSPSGVPDFIDLASGKPINTMAEKLFSDISGFHRDFGHCFQTFDHRDVVLPTRKMGENYGYQDWTYVATNDLSRIVFDFPGVAIAEVPKENILVSWGNLYVGKQQPMPSQCVFYVNRMSGQVLRKIDFKSDLHPALFLHQNATPNVIFVPGHELLVAIDPNDKNNVMMIRCGPVENAPAAAGVTINNDPPATVEVGKKFSYTPTFSKTGANKIVFKLKKALEGMAIDPANGTVTWTPTDAYIGKYDIHIVAEADGEEIPVLSWTLEIQP